MFRFALPLAAALAACAPLSAMSTDPSGGGGAPADNVQPALALRQLVLREGIYPSPGNELPGTPAFDGAGVLGEVRTFAANVDFGSRCPDASGQLLPIAQNQALFSIIGTYYGGNGQTTFALSDLRGRLAVQTGQGPEPLPIDLGQVLGSAGTVLLPDNLPSHRHPIQYIETTAQGQSAPFPIGQPALGQTYLINANA